MSASPDSFRSQYLPSFPDGSPATECSSSAPQHPSHSARDRISVLTFTSISSDLPPYSAVDSLDTNFSLEQVDHWTEVAVPGGSGASSPITPSENQPPEYTTDGQAAEAAPAPRYSSSQRPGFVLHKFHLGGQSKRLGSLNKGKQSAKTLPWATLQLVSRSPALGSRAKTPRFIGGDVIRGSVDLSLGTPMNVHTIKLVLRGKVQLVDGRTSSSSLVSTEHIFLDDSYDIYSKKGSTDPRLNGQCEISKNQDLDGSLHGSYAFPFAFPFPPFAECRDHKGKDRMESREGPTVPVVTHEVPPSFREQNMSLAVIYELGLVVVHGKLKSKSKINTEVIYVPKKISPPASSKRQTAYQEGALLPGPITDPEGWSAMKPAPVQGQFKDRAVEAAVTTLYLAQPLSYTRGTVIPCYLTFSGLDFAFLDALSTPHTTNLRLTRYITHPSLGGGSGNLKTDSTPSRQETYIAKATWWKPPKTDVPLGPEERHLEGEVHLPKALIPSCNFPFFTVEYVLELLPAQFDSFTQTREPTKLGQHEANEKNGDRPVLKSVIDIATFHEHGPIPVAFTTPVVEGEKERQMNTKAMEYLAPGHSGAAGAVFMNI